MRALARRSTRAMNSYIARPRAAHGSRASRAIVNTKPKRASIWRSPMGSRIYGIQGAGNTIETKPDVVRTPLVVGVATYENNFYS
jgi:hypothetical protein